MKIAVTFGGGLVETSESFCVVYENQFGVVCWAWQDARKVSEHMAPAEDNQAIFADTPTEGEWPDGNGAGAFVGDET